MPELPEVETTRLGICPHLVGQIISHVTIRNFKLRWPIPANLNKILTRQTVHHITRRAKYLLFHCDNGVLIIHLGMSGRLTVLDNAESIGKHDHVDIFFDNGLVLRFTDPRRFGAILWTDQDIDQHRLLNHLGPEPLSTNFNADYLYPQVNGRNTTIKTFIMDGKNVVGVGNIYANESLFLAGIHPKTRAGKLSQNQCKKLVLAIKDVLEKAIVAGGTTLKDFRKSDGTPGYFAQQLNVYGRQGEQCVHCDNKIEHYKETQRATYYCPQCQT